MCTKAVRYSLYSIESPSGKVYWVISQSVKRRWTTHRWHSTIKTKSKLYDSLRKYGCAAHAWSEIAIFSTRDEMIAAEEMCVRSSMLAGNSLNHTTGGEHRVFDDESRRKMSVAHAGQKPTDYCRQRISESQKGRAKSNACKIAISNGVKMAKTGPKTIAGKLRKKILDACLVNSLVIRLTHTAGAIPSRDIATSICAKCFLPRPLHMFSIRNETGRIRTECADCRNVRVRHRWSNARQ